MLLVTNPILHPGIIAKAEAAVQGDVPFSRRVGKLRLSYRYTELYKEVFEKHIHNPQKINQFFLDCRTYGITNFCESTPFSRTVQGLTAENPSAKRLRGI